MNLPNPPDDSHRLKGVPSEFKEPVGRADPVESEDLGPDGGNVSLEECSRRRVFPCRMDDVGRREPLPIDLAVR